MENRRPKSVHQISTREYLCRKTIMSWRLAVIFNELLARLDQSFGQQRRFMADASHELRTPVAVICGESEVALSRPAREQENIENR